MKIMDPVPRREVGWRPRGCRGWACGCVLGLLGLGVALRLLLGWMLAAGQPIRAVPEDDAAAARLLNKIDLLAYHSSPARLLDNELVPTTVVTESEVNAYVAKMRERLRSPIREAIEGLAVDLENGRFVVRGQLDIQKLVEQEVRGLPWLFDMTGRVDIQGAVEQVGAQGRVVLQSVRLGALPVPGDTVVSLVSRFYPPSRDAFKVMEGFPLPFGTKDVRVEQDRVVIQGMDQPAPQ